MTEIVNIEAYTFIISDFETFLKYCSEVRPKLTKSREFINRKALHELNQDLKMPAVDVNPRNDQQYYLPIHFYYNLALVAGLFEIDRSKKNAFYFIPIPEKIETYLALSSNHQYLFLLKTYWVYCDWETMIGSDTGRISVLSGDRLMKLLTQSEVGKVYSRKNRDAIVASTNWCLNEHIIYWEILGWLKEEKMTHLDTKSSFYYETIIITELGKKFANILYKERPATRWNEAYRQYNPYSLDILMFEEKEDLEVGLAALSDNLTSEEEVLEEEDFFESAFGALFPNEPIPNLLVKPESIFIDGQYLLKVSLKYDSKVYRTVALNAKHTLLDLHLIIQDAFEFDDDHLYAFYMNKKSEKGINDPRSEDPPFVDDFQMGELNLYSNQRFYYLFDFGDSWEFTIDLLEIKEVKKNLKTPKIIEKKGKAPEQYESYDEDDEFDDWN